MKQVTVDSYAQVSGAIANGANRVTVVEGKPGPKKSIVLGAAQIDTARLMTLKAAVKLEATGMKHSSGRSMRKVACRDLGLRLNTCADDVIGALNREIDRRAKAQAKANIEDANIALRHHE